MMNKGILYHKVLEANRIYLPMKMVETLIWECYIAYGHTGADKKHRIIMEHSYHQRLAKIIRQTLSTCDSCQRNKIPTTSSAVI